MYLNSNLLTYSMALRTREPMTKSRRNILSATTPKPLTSKLILSAPWLLYWSLSHRPTCYHSKCSTSLNSKISKLNTAQYFRKPQCFIRNSKFRLSLFHVFPELFHCLSCLLFISTYFTRKGMWEVGNHNNHYQRECIL